MSAFKTWFCTGSREYMGSDSIQWRYARMGWDAALTAAYAQIQSAALAQGWNTDSDAYQVSLIIQQLQESPSP